MKEKWYENIPEHGVLCWVWDKGAANKCIDIILGYREKPLGNGYKYFSIKFGWMNAIPLTNKEIDKLKL